MGTVCTLASATSLHLLPAEYNYWRIVGSCSINNHWQYSFDLTHWRKNAVHTKPKNKCTMLMYKKKYSLKLHIISAHCIC